MIRALLLAALALACVGSPAMAGAIGVSTSERLYAYAVPASVIFALACCGMILRAHFRGRVPPPDARIWLVPLAFMLTMLVGPALAETVTVNGQPVVILPWGDQIAAFAVALREPILTVLLPIVAAYAVQAIRRVYPWAALFLSQKRVEMMLEAAVGYGLNAVQGAAKGKTLSVEVAVPVIAKGTQYVIDTAPAAVIKAAGGRDGIAARMFRKLDLDEGGSEATVLAPAVERMDRFPPPTAEELRDAELMTRG
ncbi:hypothetical protein [Methylobacterium sp. Leaf456]|uniref:hypothetical protein n=1 Tax=Methylobacterium sp. Leaf456 TaxID=1736382 RepID=UPI000AA24120|nr:hypothetical protein [Methylobacterium sp. Leaf456]